MSLETDAAGERDPRLELELRRAEARLRLEQGQVVEATALLVPAVGIARHLADPERVAWVLVEQAEALGTADAQAALTLLGYAQGPLAEAAGDSSRLGLAIGHARLWHLVELGHGGEGAPLLAELAPLYAQHRDSRPSRLLPWLEGRLARLLGLLEEAQVLLGSARELLAASGHLEPMTLATVDLLETYVARGEADEALRSLAAEQERLLGAADVPAEVLRLWRPLAADPPALGPERARQLIAELRRSFRGEGSAAGEAPPGAIARLLSEIEALLA